MPDFDALAKRFLEAIDNKDFVALAEVLSQLDLNFSMSVSADQLGRPDIKLEDRSQLMRLFMGGSEMTADYPPLDSTDVSQEFLDLAQQFADAVKNQDLVKIGETLTHVAPQNVSYSLRIREAVANPGFLDVVQLLASLSLHPMSYNIHIRYDDREYLEITGHQIQRHVRVDTGPDNTHSWPSMDVTVEEIARVLHDAASGS